MKYFALLILLLIPLPVYSIGPMVAHNGAGGTTGTWHKTTWEDQTFNGWKGADGVSDPSGMVEAYEPYEGTYAYHTPGFNIASPVTVKRTIDTAAGTMVVMARDWLDSGLNSECFVAIYQGGVEKLAPTEVEGTYVALTAQLTAGSAQEVKIVMSTNQDVSACVLDTIRIPVPMP